MNEPLYDLADEGQGTAQEPPHSTEAEQAVIGSALMRPESLDELRFLAPSDFHAGTHARIWQAILKGHASGQPVRPLHLKPMMDADPDAQETGGFAYLNDICLDLLPASMIPAMARLVKDMAARRKILGVIEAASSDARDWQPDYPAAEIVSRAVEALQQIETPAREVRRSLASIAEAAYQNATGAQSHVWRAMSGLTDLDERCGGFEPGELIVVAGRPGMGKSLFANRLARAVCEQKRGVVFFALEMSAEAQAQRFMADLSRDHGAEIWYSTMRKGKVREMDRQVLARCAGDLDTWPLRIEDCPQLTVGDMTQAALAEVSDWRKRGIQLGLVVVDHIGLVKPPIDRRGNRVQEMTDITAGLKAMAKTLNCAVIAVSQLNRGVEGREDKRPLLSDLRDSGSVEQDADAVLLLYREEYYVRQREAALTADSFRAELATCRRRLEVNAAKVRAGEPGVVICDIDVATGTIRDEGDLR